MQYERRGSQIYVMVFRTYRREAVIVTTTRLPVSLIFSGVTVDNHMWPSVSLGLCSVVSGFLANCQDVPLGVTGSDVTPALRHIQYSLWTMIFKYSYCSYLCSFDKHPKWEHILLSRRWRKH